MTPPPLSPAHVGEGKKGKGKGLLPHLRLLPATPEKKGRGGCPERKGEARGSSCRATKEGKGKARDHTCNQREGNHLKEGEGKRRLFFISAPGDKKKKREREKKGGDKEGKLPLTTIFLGSGERRASGKGKKGKTCAYAAAFIDFFREKRKKKKDICVSFFIAGRSEEIPPGTPPYINNYAGVARKV